MPENLSGALTSWKEIATFLGRDVRTVQRWERKSGLPVHRVPGGNSHGVYAYPDEINAWLQHRPDVVDSPGLPPRNWTVRKSPILVLSILLLSGFAFFTSRIQREGELGRLTFGDSKLLAWSDDGKLLWTYDFGQPLWPGVPALEKDQQIQFLDSGGDKVAVVAAPLCLYDRGDLSTDALFCFSSKGKLLWSHRINETISFGHTDYGPRWQIGAIMADSDSHGQFVWCAADELPWWPSLLLKFDRDGRRATEFINSGHLHTLNSIHSSNGRFILAGGINNEFSEAMLAVLNDGEPSGASPQSPGSFHCDNCPAGAPYRYFLFPRSEVNRAVGIPFNQTTMVQVDDRGLHVVVSETSPNPGGLAGEWQIYDFTADLKPLSVSVSEFYWETHRRLSDEGKIRHSAENCPERTVPRIVREWSPQEGWQEIRFPVSNEEPQTRR